MMKRNLIAVLTISALLTGCAETNQVPEVNTDADVLQEEQTGKVYGCDASKPADCQDEESEDGLSEDSFTQISMDEAIDFFASGKTGLLYFGYPDCPWCRELVPLLAQAADENGVEVFYIRTRDDEKNRLYTDEQKEEIEPYLSSYMSDNEDGVLTLYVPLVAAVKNGEVFDGHVGTVDGYDAHERDMTEEEKEEVQAVLEDLVKEAAALDED